MAPRAANDPMEKEQMAKEPMRRETMSKDAMLPTVLNLASSAVDLSKHVGHKINGTGTVAVTMAKGSMPKDTMAKDKMTKDTETFTLKSLTMVATSCK